MGRLLDSVNSWLGYLSGLLFFIIMLVMVRDVLGRYFFNAPLWLGQDLTTQMMLVAMFFGASYVLSIRGFAMVDILYNRFSPRLQQVVQLLNSLAGLAFLGVLFWQVVSMVVDAYVWDAKTTTPALIPLVIPYCAMAIGVVFFILETVREGVAVASSLVRGPMRETGGLAVSVVAPVDREREGGSV